MLDKLFRVCNNVRKLDSDKLLKKVFDRPEVQQKVIALQRSQMYDYGVDSEGRSLGNYSDASVKVFGKRPGFIQVYDTGEFQGGIKVKSDTQTVIIQADTIKQAWDGAIDLLDRWPNLLGLNEKSLSQIREFIRPIFIEEIRAGIFA